MVLPEFDLAKGEHLYLLLDGGQIPELERKLFEVTDSPAYQPIYLYAPWDALREASPCLVEASPALLDWYAHGEEGWGYILSSRLPLLPLAERLRQLIEVESPYGSCILLKMAQPDGMFRLLIDDEPWLWQAIEQVWIPVHKLLRPNSPAEWWNKKVSTSELPVGKLLRLSDVQWTRLGEVTWLNTLNDIWRHMEKWFPERLGEQFDGRQWVAEWAEWGYGKGFESPRDLLFFFNVLGYLGTAWKESDAYPAITALLMCTSSLTPSQRIEQAAELAETQHRMGTEI